jgi:hypothetical protein
MSLLISRLKTAADRQLSTIDHIYTKSSSNNYLMVSSIRSLRDDSMPFDQVKELLFKKTKRPQTIKKTHKKFVLDRYFNRLAHQELDTEEFLSYTPPVYLSHNSKNLDFSYLLKLSKKQAKKESHRKVFSYIAHNLTCKGILKINSNGCVYLDVDDQFIHAMFLFIEDKNILKPPFFKTCAPPYGAHINVILESEYRNKIYIPVEEIGKEVKFFIKGLYSIDPEDNQDFEKVWFLEIESPSLEKLREKYHLPPKIKGHNFKITIATKKSSSKKKLPLMKINISHIAA